MSLDAAKIMGGVGKVGGLNPTSPAKPGKVEQGPSFKDTLNQLDETGLQNPASPAINDKLKFSAHAVERMQTRGIQFAPEQMSKIEGALEKAKAKGAKETLVLTDNSALIVSVKNNTVVTVMDSQSLKENVFTNIDSTVMI